MPNLKPKHSHRLHWTHFLAALILVGYTVLSKGNYVHAITNGNIISMFFQLYLFGIFFGCLFLYIFSHDKFFPVARDIERRQKNKEEKFLKRFKHHGKVLATLIIGAIGGPVFSSLTARLLLNNYTLKYLIVILANIPSSILAVALGKGVISLL